jgi:hypothetical protein
VRLSGATSQLEECSVESRAVERRQGGWCDMAASLGASEFEGSRHSKRT